MEYERTDGADLRSIREIIIAKSYLKSAGHRLVTHYKKTTWVLKCKSYLTNCLYTFTITN